MGCVNSNTLESKRQDFATNNGKKSTDKSMELSIVPGQVQHLTLTHCPSLPSLILNWEAPANSLEAGNVLQYCIRITPVSSGDDDVADDDVADDDFADDDVADEDALPKEVVVEGDTTMLEFSNKDGLRPLHGYMFEVCAKSCRHVTGDWSKVEGFLDWLCRFPSCGKNRLKLEDEIYNFCSREHKIRFDERYCFYPECNNTVPISSLSSSTQSGNSSTVLVRDMDHFCSEEHFQLTLRNKSPNHNGIFFIKVEPSCLEFKDVESIFQKKWSSKEMVCPSLTMVIAIFNPYQDVQFANYRQVKEKKDKDIVKTFFFGTKLGCDLHSYLSPCRNFSNFLECGVCNLASEGFNQLVSPMIPLDKNPADAHNKAESYSDSFIYGLLMCDVACANTKKMSRKVCDIEGRLHGADTMNVRNNSFLGNTNEIRIYNASAVCPRYVLIYV